MKAIIMSIKPKWVAKILNGEKTIEIRKRFPSDYRGWVYIYCTKDKEIFLRDFRDKKKWAVYWKFIAMGNDPSNVGKLPPILNDKVVARFWCDKVEEITPFEEQESIFGRVYKLTKDIILCCQRAQLTYDEYNRYLKGKNGYAIHISNLEIFDKPKELSEFYKVGANAYQKDIEQDYGERAKRYTDCFFQLTKAPQNFCYVEVE